MTGVQTCALPIFSAQEITPRYRFISEQKAGPVYITDFQLQKVDYNHLGSDEFTVN